MYRGQCTGNTTENPNIIITITTTTTYLLTYLLIYLITAVELPRAGSSPYTSTDKTNKNKYT